MKIQEIIKTGSDTSYTENWLSNEQKQKFLNKNNIVGKIFEKYPVYFFQENEKENYGVLNNDILVAWAELLPTGVTSKFFNNLYMLTHIKSDKTIKGLGFNLVQFLNKDLQKTIVCDSSLSDDAIRMWKNLIQADRTNVVLYDVKQDQFHDEVFASKDDKIKSTDGKTIILSPEEEITQNADYYIDDKGEVQGIQRPDMKFRFFWLLESSVELLHDRLLNCRKKEPTGKYGIFESVKNRDELTENLYAKIRFQEYNEKTPEIDY